MIEFKLRHINRMHFPDKNVVVCEDDILHQAEIAHKINTLFDRQGKVQFTFTCSGVIAASAMANVKTSLLVLDHDMPIGNGTDLINWMHENKVIVPILTFSGIDQNNINMETLCKTYNIPCYKFSKFDVIEGKADHILKAI